MKTTTASTLLTKLTAVLILCTVPALSGISETHGDSDPPKLFTVITSDSTDTQFMALILATQSARQGAEVRILLCDDAGLLALKDRKFPAVEPLGRSPQELLEGLIEDGVKVEVCAIFLPNRNYGEDDLIGGIGIAKPGEVAKYMLEDGVRYFTF